jgi:signal transduction histidine kinase
VEAGDFTITRPYVYASVEALGITGVLPLWHPEGRFVGVLGLDIMLEDLKNMIEELRVQKGGRVILLNQENQVIVSQFDENHGGSGALELKDFTFFDVEEVESRKGRHFFTGRDGVTSYYISHTRNEKTGWKLFIALPYEEVMSQATDNIKFVIFIDVMLMLLLSVVIGFLSNIIILHPLEHTVNVMRRLEQGETEARVPVKTRDEFGTLARQFNRLIETVNDYHQRLEEKVRRRTEEIASLQQENIRLRIIEEKERIYGYLHDSLGARLTNIFISNNVAQSAVANDPELLRRMLKQIERNTQQAIEDLKEILFSSQNENRKMINFPRVLKHNITERLNLKGIALTFLCKTPEDFNELNRETRFEIEKILQELVSNVLKHSEASRVDVSLDMQDGRIHIDFADNGVGIPPERRDASGFGLQSMRNRIGHFGGGIEIDSPVEGGTAIRINMPVLVEEQEEKQEKAEQTGI